MSTVYIYCKRCEGMFITSPENKPKSSVCIMGRCEIVEVTQEEALKIAEDKLNERS